MAKKTKSNIKLYVIIGIVILIIGIVSWGFATNWKFVGSSKSKVKSFLLKKPIKAGSNRIDIEDNQQKDLKIGQELKFGDGTNSETRTIIGFGSLILDKPLKNNYPIGTIVVITNKETCGYGCAKCDNKGMCLNCIINDENEYYLENGICKNKKVDGKECLNKNNGKECINGMCIDGICCNKKNCNNCDNNGMCKLCHNKYFLDKNRECKPLTQCNNNQYILTPSTITSDQECKDYSYDSDNCLAIERKIFTSGTNTTDSTCITCSNTKFVNDDNECQNYSYDSDNCLATKRKIFTQGTNTTDSTCISCNNTQFVKDNECKDYSYDSDNCLATDRKIFTLDTNTTNNECKTCEDTQFVKDNECQNYSIQSANCQTTDRKIFTQGTNTTNSTCKTCEDTQFVKDNECQNYSYDSDNCLATKRKIFTLDTNTTDNECKTCEDTQFVKDNECKDYSYDSDNCLATKRKIFTSGTNTTDNECKTCEDTQFVKDNECQNYSYDSDNCQTTDRKIFTQGTNTTNSTCKTCEDTQFVNDDNECKDYSYDSDNCLATDRKIFTQGTNTTDNECKTCENTQFVKDNECTPLTICNINNQYEFSEPSATIDRVCYQKIPNKTKLQTSIYSIKTRIYKKEENPKNYNTKVWIWGGYQYYNITYYNNTDNIHPTYGPIKNWQFEDTLKDFSNLFYEYPSFNEDISGWKVGKVTNMNSMFKNCKDFNQDLSSWDVSNVITTPNRQTKGFESMFENCTLFNNGGQPMIWTLNEKVNENEHSLAMMFMNCKNFNQDISSWNVSNVYTFYKMFAYCINFEYKQQILNVWDTKNSTTSMFKGCCTNTSGRRLLKRTTPIPTN